MRKKQSKKRSSFERPSIIPPPKRFSIADWKELIGKRPQCGARTKDGTPCMYPAGWGTDHFGVGRCIYHEVSIERSKAPLLFYLDPDLRAAVITFMNSDDLLNLRAELAVLRYRFAEINNIDFQSLDPDEARKWLREVENLAKTMSFMAQTIDTLERGSHKYIHVSVTGSIIEAVATITKHYISQDQMENFLAELREAVRENIRRDAAKELAVSALLPDTTFLAGDSEDTVARHLEEEQEWK